MDNVNFGFSLCPHIRVRINAWETWGTHHTYTGRGYCESCGYVTHEERRPAYSG